MDVFVVVVCYNSYLDETVDTDADDFVDREDVLDDDINDNDGDDEDDEGGELTGKLLF